MKQIRQLVSLVAILVAGTVTSLAAGLDIREPGLDGQGRFWVFVASNAPMPYVPYAWMPEAATNIMTMDTACTTTPQGEGVKRGEKDTCISVSLKWGAPFWCGVAFLSGPEGPPAWWGDDDRGWAYDLSKLKNKRLVFYARSDEGARIQAKVGILGSKGENGDSLKFPAESRWLKLTKEWKRYEIDLSKYKAEDLKRICNGFTFVVNRDQQDGAKEKTQFFLDTIYFE